MTTDREIYHLTKIEAVESAAGDFDLVYLKSVPSQALPIPTGETRLVCVGYRWQCGCETRGNAPICFWAPCRAHELAAHELRETPLPEELRGGFVARRVDAQIKNGGFLRMPIDEYHRLVD
jgi:hypothetical protein